MEKYQISIEEILDDEKKASMKIEEIERKQKEFEIHKVSFGSVWSYVASPIWLLVQLMLTSYRFP